MPPVFGPWAESRGDSVTGNLGPGYAQQAGDPHLSARLSNMESHLAELRSTNRDISESLKTLARLEERVTTGLDRLDTAMEDAFKLARRVEARTNALETQHATADRRLLVLEEVRSDVLERLDALEEAMPEFRQTNSWVKGTVLGAAILVGGLVGGMAMERLRGFIAPPPAAPPPVVQPPDSSASPK